MAIPEILITAGVVAVLAAVAGGGLKGFGVEVPLLASVRRQVMLLLVGAGLVGLGLYSARMPQGEAGKAEAASGDADAAGPPAGNAAVPSAVAPAAAAATGGRPEMPNIVELPFPVARQFLIQNSWSPINSASGPLASADALGFRAEEVFEAGYREAVACSGTGAAPCTFRYRHPTGAILEVVTVGEDLKQAIVNNARILDCKADPKPEACNW